MNTTKFTNLKKCIKCGDCCTKLYLPDCMKISWSTKSFMLSRICKFLIKDKCSIHGMKPDVCRKWSCGIAKQERSKNASLY